MNLFDVIILSIVEGITEFLPISSTGHLVLTSHLLGIPQTEFLKSFEIIIQLGAILAVVVMYAPKFLTNKAVWVRVLTAFLPTAIIGFFAYDYIKDVLLGNEYITLAALFIGGVILILLELLYKEKEHHTSELEKMSLKQSVSIGLMQSLSMIPGTSRAATTIIGGLFLGLKRKTAVEFSFLLAVPTMLAASGLDILKTEFTFSAREYSYLLLGFVGSFIVAYITIKFLLKYVQKHTFIPFGVYRVVLSFLYWVFLLR